LVLGSGLGCSDERRATVVVDEDVVVAPPRDAMVDQRDTTPAVAEPVAEPTPSTSPGACGGAPPIEIPTRRKFIRHRVVPRETLRQIAFRYGVTVEELRAWNDLSDDTQRVKRRTRLRIKARRIPPPRKKVEYTVVEGDTWWRVAVRHGVDRRDLRAYNWPYRGKMKPGATVVAWVDPAVYGWISEDPPRFDDDAPDPVAVVRRGGYSIGTPDDGSLVNPVEIPEAPGWDVRMQNSSYGTSYAVERLVRGLQAFGQRTSWKGTIRLGSMSSSVGGRIGHHKSHQSGRDIDIRLPRKEGVPRGIPLRAKRIDWRVAWELIETLAQHDAVVIFLEYKMQRRVHKAAKAAGVSDERLAILQYPRGGYSKEGMVRHDPGHDHHIHVRYGCGPCETECISSRTGTDFDSPP
jgi:hypothetical protein